MDPLFLPYDFVTALLLQELAFITSSQYFRIFALSCNMPPLKSYTGAFFLE